ncbi:farnesol dehydrogenase-like [Phlebotomus argentipes]|uniref:farnesol dehydrogenase-like n=1 Tax=Phlebotomus argentipes TaxID=94469 RepID=UPI0028933B34|nr:farnesol dehydrogenase-like [Phlebotomus argentipes]
MPRRKIVCSGKRASHMDRWVNRVAVVTGASSGIGAEISKDLTKAGMVVVGLARRVDRLDELRSGMPEQQRINFHGIKCDVMDEEEVTKTFLFIEEKFGGIDVLVNNAGVYDPSMKLFQEGNHSKISETINTNITGFISCTREAFKSMKKRSFPGHIINMNSISGHNVPNLPTDYYFNVYAATKHAITALTETERQEFAKERLGIKVSSISPGIVQTELSPHFSKEALGNFPHLFPQDVSRAVLYVLGTPPHVQIQEITIKPIRVNS